MDRNEIGYEGVTQDRDRLQFLVVIVGLLSLLRENVGSFLTS
jgi:hypothetical protein